MTRRYVLGDVEVRPAERLVLAQGQPVAIGSRALDLLVCLIEHRERVVSKAELLDRVWPGVVVEENNLQVQVSSLRKLLGPQAVATVPGRGYRFTMAVQDQASQAAAVSAAVPAVPDLPSIAVLPFDNLGGDRDQEGFIDGVIEDVITELSRFRSLFVIARNSTYSYKGTAVDVRTVARELGVRYVVEGSVRFGAGRVRLSAQLVDALNGQQIWAERYDRTLEDLFMVQEALTEALVAAIAPQIESSELKKLRSMRPGNPTAYQLAMRARDVARWADREAQTASEQDALALAHEALALDPHCGTALGTVAYLHWRQAWGHAGQPDTAMLEPGLAAARKAIAIDSGDHVAHLWKGMLLLAAGQHAAGLADLRRAHDLNPNDALTLSLLGQNEASAGHHREAIAHVQAALRLSPRDNLRWSYLNSLAWALFAAGDCAGAAEAAQSSVAAAPRFHPPRLCLVISLVGLGQVGEASAELAGLRALAPQQLEQRLAGHWPLVDDALRQRALASLRVAAGVVPPAG